MAREHTPEAGAHVQLPPHTAAASFRCPLHQQVGKLRIVVENIPENGLDVRIDTSSDWAVEAAQVALEGSVQSVSGEARVSRRGARARVEGHLEAAALGVCARCGEDVELALSAEVDLAYVPVAKEGDEEQELEAEDLDVGWYAGGALELGDVICEALSLALPPRVSCADEPACDARTAALLAAEGKSGEPGHPGFAALKGRFS